MPKRSPLWRATCLLVMAIALCASLGYGDTRFSLLTDPATIESYANELETSRPPGLSDRQREIATATLQSVRARVAIARGDIIAARTCLARIHSSDDRAWHAAMIGYGARRNHLPDAAIQLTSQIAGNDGAAAIGKLGEFLAGEGDIDGAEASLEQLPQVSGERIELSIALMDCYVQAGQPEKARKLGDATGLLNVEQRIKAATEMSVAARDPKAMLRIIERADPDDPALDFVLREQNLRYRTGDHTAMVRTAEAIGDTPVAQNLRLMAVDLLVKAKDRDAAIKLVASAEPRSYERWSDSQVSDLALAYLQLDMPTDAWRVIEAANANSPRKDLLLRRDTKGRGAILELLVAEGNLASIGDAIAVTDQFTLRRGASRFIRRKQHQLLWNSVTGISETDWENRVELLNEMARFDVSQ